MSCTTNYDQQPCQPITTGDLDTLVYIKGKNAAGCDKYAPFVAAPTPFITGIVDTPSVDLSVLGGILSADSKISGAVGNQISINPDGLFVPAAPPETACSVGLLAVNGTPVSQVGKDAAGCLVSFPLPTPDTACSLGALVSPGTQVSYVGKDATGCLVSFTPPAIPADFITGINDTNTINLTVAAGVLTADAIIDPNATNALVANPGGLFVDVPVKGVRVDGVLLAPDVNGIVNVTDNDINAILDTNSVNLTLVGNQLQADILVDPMAGNALVVNPAGLFVPGLCDQLTGVDTVTDATVPASADVLYKRTDGTCGRAPLPATAAPFVTSIGDTTSIDLDVTGGQLTANVIVNPTGLITNGAAGLTLLCEDVQDCIAPMFGSFATYNDAGNVLTFNPSADPGNVLTLGGDGRPYAPDLCTQVIALPPSGSLPSGAAVVFVDGGGNCGFAPLTNSFSLAGDAGGVQTVALGETLTLAGGTGIQTVVSAPDTLTVQLDRCDIQPLAPDAHLDINSFLVLDASNCLARIDVTETCLDANVNMIHGLGYRNPTEGWVFGRFRERKVFMQFTASATPSYTIDADADNVIAIVNDAPFTANLPSPNPCQALDFHVKVLQDAGFGFPITVNAGAGHDIAPATGAPVTSLVFPANSGRENFHFVFDGTSRWHIL